MAMELDCLVPFGRISSVAGRYVAGEVPNAVVNEFDDLILCSHFPLLYSAQLSWESHAQAVTK